MQKKKHQSTQLPNIIFVYFFVYSFLISFFYSKAQKQPQKDTFSFPFYYKKKKNDFFYSNKNKHVFVKYIKKILFYFIQILSILPVRRCIFSNLYISMNLFLYRHSQEVRTKGKFSIGNFDFRLSIWQYSI